MTVHSTNRLNAGLAKSGRETYEEALLSYCIVKNPRYSYKSRWENLL